MPGQPLQSQGDRRFGLVGAAQRPSKALLTAGVRPRMDRPIAGPANSAPGAPLRSRMSAVAAVVNPLAPAGKLCGARTCKLFFSIDDEPMPAATPPSSAEPTVRSPTSWPVSRKSEAPGSTVLRCTATANNARMISRLV